MEIDNMLDIRTIAYHMALEGKRFVKPWVRGEKGSAQQIADLMVMDMIEYVFFCGNLDGFQYYLDDFMKACGNHLYKVQEELWRTGFDIKLIHEPCIIDYNKYFRFLGLSIRLRAMANKTYVTFIPKKVIRTGDLPSIPVTAYMKGFNYV